VGVKRSIVIAGCTALVGLLLWLRFVVALPDGETSAPTFWWIMLLAALSMGAMFSSQYLVAVSLGLGVPPLVLSPWTAPRGDGDGLWLLWIPLLALFLLVLAAAAWLGGAARARLQPRP
jgi:hypothetical protein